jgi:hypothetical protein
VILSELTHAHVPTGPKLQSRARLLLDRASRRAVCVVRAVLKISTLNILKINIPSSLSEETSASSLGSLRARHIHWRPPTLPRASSAALSG